MDMNFIAIGLAALIPLITGFIWYNPKTFGNMWMQAAGMTAESMKGANMGLIFALTLVMGFFIAFTMQFLVIHQHHMLSILMNEPGIGEAGSEVQMMYDSFIAQYGSNFRTFKHGAFHGALDALFLITPIMAINAMFERKSFKYIAVNAGYWILTLALIGGVVCQWA